MPSLKVLSGSPLAGQVINLGLSIAIAGLMGNVLHWVRWDSFTMQYHLDPSVVQVPGYTPDQSHPFIASAPDSFAFRTAGSQLIFIGGMASVIASLITIGNLMPVFAGRLDPTQYKLPARFAAAVFLTVLSTTFSIFALTYSWTEFYEAKPVVYTADNLLTGDYNPVGITPETFNRDIAKMVVLADRYGPQELHLNAMVARIMSLPLWVLQIALLAVLILLWKKVNAVLVHRQSKGKDVELVSVEHVEGENNHM